MSLDAQNQAAAWRMRRANRSRQFIAGATPWAAGLVIVAGDIVQSFGLAFTAQNGGTTLGTAPNNATGGSFTDGGGVRWAHTPLLLVAPELI
jgi:hypothetical protein